MFLSDYMLLREQLFYFKYMGGVGGGVENKNVLAIKIHASRNCFKPYFRLLLLTENIRNDYEFSLMSFSHTLLLTVFCFKLN